MAKQIRDRHLWIEYGVLENEHVTGSDLMVYMGLARFVDNETQRCYPSISALEKVCRLNKTTVIKSIRHLEDLGLIYVGRTPNKVNHYELLRVGGGKSRLVEKREGSGGNKGTQVVEIRETNNTYINKTYITTKWFKDLTRCVRDNLEGINNPEAYVSSLVSKYSAPLVEKLCKQNINVKEWTKYLESWNKSA